MCAARAAPARHRKVRRVLLLARRPRHHAVPLPARRRQPLPHRGAPHLLRRRQLQEVPHPARRQPGRGQLVRTFRIFNSLFQIV